MKITKTPTLPNQTLLPIKTDAGSKSTTPATVSDSLHTSDSTKASTKLISAENAAIATHEITPREDLSQQLNAIRAQGNTGVLQEAPAAKKMSGEELVQSRKAQLKPGEHVLPDDVLDAYAGTVAKTTGFSKGPAAGYLATNYLDTRGERREFAERLDKLGYNAQEKKGFTKLLKQDDVVIIKESALKGPNFKKYIEHERLHREFQKIDNKDHELMMDVAAKLVRQKNPDGSPVVQEHGGSKYLGGFARMSAQQNPEELYTYLAQGEFNDETAKALQKESPKAYALYTDLVNRIKIDE